MAGLQYISVSDSLLRDDFLHCQLEVATLYLLGYSPSEAD